MSNMPFKNREDILFQRERADHDDTKRNLAAMTDAKNKALEALKSIDCSTSTDRHAQERHEALIAELEEVK